MNIFEKKLKEEEEAERLAKTDPAEEFIRLATETNEHIFLTGDGGTGKTTLIQRLRKIYDELGIPYVVLAPTGIAAINAGGQTIHSFYGFRSGAIDYAHIANLKDNPQKLSAYLLHKKVLKVLIDEISMVRADIMDYIDWFYDKNFPGLPFGGKQIIMVGDLDQLPPVVGSEEERKFINQKFGNEFFFSAKCWQRSEFKIIKLTKIWRQNDPVFIGLLNRIKNNKTTVEDLEFINRVCVKEGKPSPQAGGIAVTATKERAENINIKMLFRLPGEFYRFEARVTGDFNQKNAPVNPLIEIKKGARVMFAINDPDKPRRFVNGTMGTLTDIIEFENEEGVKEDPILKIELDNGEIIRLARATFEQRKFVYDPEKESIKDSVSSTFEQYPLKLAYAITIHKSQGLTFDRLIIDLGKGAFSHGQVYVALSRCRTLEGITLTQPLNASDLIYNDVVLNFNSKL